MIAAYFAGALTTFVVGAVFIRVVLVRLEREKVALRAALFNTDQALVDALDGRAPRAWLESSGIDVVVRTRTPRPYDGLADIIDLTGAEDV